MSTKEIISTYVYPFCSCLHEMKIFLLTVQRTILSQCKCSHLVLFIHYFMFIVKIIMNYFTIQIWCFPLLERFMSSLVFCCALSWNLMFIQNQSLEFEKNSWCPKMSELLKKMAKRNSLVNPSSFILICHSITLGRRFMTLTS